MKCFPPVVCSPTKCHRCVGRGSIWCNRCSLENQALGYLVTSISDRDGSMHEELRSSVSSALKGVLLFEEAVRAKEVAERAEQAKMEFFATMGDGLKEPLATILDKMNQLDTMVHDQPRLSTSLGGAIGSVRDEMEAQLNKTSLLFDYTLAQAGVLELDMKLCSPAACLLSLAAERKLFLDCPERLPLLNCDKERLGQAVGLFADHFMAREHSDLHLVVSAVPAGLRIRFLVSGATPTEAETTNQLSLARSIVLLHHGNVVFSDTGAELSLPWAQYRRPRSHGRFGNSV